MQFPYFGAQNLFTRLFLIIKALGRQKMRFYRSRPTEFPLIAPPPHGTENGIFHILSLEEQIGVTKPPILGARVSFVRLFLMIQALGRQKMRYSMSRPPKFLSLRVHSLPRYPKWVFFLPRSGMAIMGHNHII